MARKAISNLQPLQQLFKNRYTKYPKENKFDLIIYSKKQEGITEQNNNPSNSSDSIHTETAKYNKCECVPYAKINISRNWKCIFHQSTKSLKFI